MCRSFPFRRPACVGTLLVCSLVCFWGSLGAAPAADPAALDGKEVFTRGFPQWLAFRGEMQRALHRDYATWSAAVAEQAGVIRKFIPEELPRIHPESPAWAGRFAREHPGKLMLLHFNGEARQVTTDAAVHQRYFPGHWVYEPGSLLTAPLTEAATVLSVADASRFRVDAYLDRGDNETGKHWFPQILSLVPLDESGRRDWYRAEFAVVTGVDRRANAITVKRGQLFSTARAHATGRTYVAPLAAGVWGGAPMAFYNLASTCPRDREGKTAADVLVREIAGWFAPGGVLAAFNGVAFDVNKWYAREPKWDVDNDGRGDGGMIDGVNVWRLGDWKFLQDLRQALGENRILTADGQHSTNQQAVGILDGIESEGLVQHNDGFRGFSRTVNTHLYWAENTVRPHPFRYVVLKLMNPADAKRGDSLRRLAIGTACSLGAMTTTVPAGILPREFAAAGSLGFPVGDLLRPARQTPDLLGGAGLTSRLEATGCTLQRHADRIEIAAAPNADSLRVTLKDLAVPAGDLTVFVEMAAIEPLEGFPRDSLVPRRVEAHFSPLPKYGEGRYDAYYSELNGYIGTQRRSRLAFYLRRPGMPAQTMDVSLVIEGRGRVNLFALSAHSAADSLVRAFTHGVVVVNPSLEPLDISLRGMPGAGGSLPTSVKVPALDARFLPRR